MQCTSVVCDLEVSAHFQTENHMGKLGVIQKPLRVWSIFVLRFLISYYNRRLFSKVENKKKKAKTYYQSNKEKLPIRLQEYYRNLCEDEKIKKRNYAYIGNKYM